MDSLNKEQKVYRTSQIVDSKGNTRMYSTKDGSISIGMPWPFKEEPDLKIQLNSVCLNHEENTMEKTWLEAIVNLKNGTPISVEIKDREETIRIDEVFATYHTIVEGNINLFTNSDGAISLRIPWPSINIGKPDFEVWYNNVKLEHVYFNNLSKEDNNMKELNNNLSVWVFWLGVLYMIGLLGSRFNPILLLLTFAGIYLISLNYKITFIEACGLIKRTWLKGWVISREWLLNLTK
jgi:hypothetical protein